MAWNTVYLSLLLFILFSFLGWLQETVIVYVETKKWTDRGFLTGPFCPIYGTGVAVLYLFLAPIRHNLILVFIFGALIATTLEYITSVVMELVFKTRWWDYSNRKFNLNGRIALAPSLFWGVLSTVVIGLVFDPLYNFVTTYLTFRQGYVVINCILVIMLVDFAISAYNAFGLNKILSELANIKIDIKEHIEATRLHDSLELIKEKGYDIKERLSSLNAKYNIKILSPTGIQRRLLKAFPQIKSTQYNTILDELKARLKDR